MPMPMIDMPLFMTPMMKGAARSSLRGTAMPLTGESAGGGAPALRLQLKADLEPLSNAGVDQRNQGVDRLRRDGTGAGVETEARHLVFRRHHALQDRYEALQVQELVESCGDIAGFQSVDRGGGKIDAADSDIAGLLAGFLQDISHLTGDVAVLGADCLQVGMGLDVGGKHVGCERGVGVHLLADL